MISGDSQKIIDLHCQGWGNNEIAENLGFSQSKVASALTRARQRKQIPPPQFLPHAEYMLRNGNIRKGNIIHILQRLDAHCLAWLEGNVRIGGYESTAEYLLDLLLDEYERQKK